MSSTIFLSFLNHLKIFYIFRYLIFPQIFINSCKIRYFVMTVSIFIKKFNNHLIHLSFHILINFWQNTLLQLTPENSPFFPYKRINWNIFRLQFFQNIQILLQILNTLIRNSKHQIYGNIVKSSFSSHFVHIYRIIWTMLPSNKVQNMILKTLYPNTQPVYPNFPNFLQFFQSHVSRIQFQSNLRIPSPVQFIHYFLYHPNRQYRGRSPTKINRIILKLWVHPNFPN